MKKIKMGIDVNITKVRVNKNKCCYCGGNMIGWGFSFGTESDFNHYNAWIHIGCLKKLNEVVIKGCANFNGLMVKRIIFSAGYSVVYNEKHYCSYCGKEDDINGFVVIGKKNEMGVNLRRLYCHINCLNELYNKYKPRQKKINEDILIEEI